MYTVSNTCTRVYNYVHPPGFDPLVKDSEGWLKAIARFNPGNETATTESDDESVPDCENEREEDAMRQESAQLVKEVLDAHFKRQNEILKSTIEEDRALRARMRSTGSLNPDNYSGLDASSKGNISRLEQREEQKETARAEAEAKQLRLRHTRARRDVEDKETFDTCISRTRSNNRSPLVGDLSSDNLVRICRHLGLHPKPNASGRINKPERFTAFKDYYRNLFPDTTRPTDQPEVMYVSVWDVWVIKVTPTHIIPLHVGFLHTKVIHTVCY